jgi:transposase-like protein
MPCPGFRGGEKLDSAAIIVQGDGMARTSRCSQEVRERAVRMVFEHRDEYDSEWEAIGSIAKKIGCTSETLRKWVRQANLSFAEFGIPKQRPLPPRRSPTTKTPPA